MLVIFGGVLLLTPGFITDIFGLLFLFPPTRVLLRGLLVRRGALRAGRRDAGHGEPAERPHAPPDDIEGTAVDVDSDHLDPPR